MLKEHYGDESVACQGIGGGYSADVADNLLPDGTSKAAIEEGLRLFNLAHSKCPNTTIVGDGYSQGAALVHGIAKGLSPAVQDQVAGLVTFGDTRNGEDAGHIPPFPDEKVKIICLPLDGVCGELLIPNLEHLEYFPFFEDGAKFLISRIGA